MEQGIIFDVDGTLWDATENIAKSWDDTVQIEAGGICRVTAEMIQSVAGRTMTELAVTVFPMLKKEEAIALMQLCGERENEYLRIHGGVLYPGLEDTLRKLSKDYRLFIVSNCQKGYIETFLAYYQFGHYFEDIECFGNNEKEKAYNIALIADRNGLDRAAYVGDIQGDYDASQKAGVSFIHAAYGFGSIAQKTPSIRNLPELTRVAAEVFAGASPRTGNGKRGFL